MELLVCIHKVLWKCSPHQKFALTLVTLDTSNTLDATSGSECSSPKWLQDDRVPGDHQDQLNIAKARGLEDLVIWSGFLTKQDLLLLHWYTVNYWGIAGKDDSVLSQL